VLVHDLHPDYASTRYARQRAASQALEVIAVQHHHAHLASCLADNGLCEPAIGVTFDGTGYGADGAIWGGEFLVGDFGGYRRAAHLRYVGMPGGEQAIREPWRMALAHLLDAGCDPDIVRPALPPASLRTVRQMLARQVQCPATSSMGRLFDAVAVLAGLRQRISYEGQAAMELQWLATDAAPGEPYPFEVVPPCAGHAHTARSHDSQLNPGQLHPGQLHSGQSTGGPLVVDTRPLIRAVAADCRRGAAPAAIARALHDSVVDIVIAVCERLRVATGLELVALSGGVFLNSLLACAVSDKLRQRDFRVCTHRHVPPGDGGLSLGQLAVAAHALSHRSAADAAACEGAA
jgi:hydrogenase maturation protein HypF